MDEGTGSVAYDNSPFGNDGTISGCSWNAESTGFDSDGDGVLDEDDDYPTDATRAFDNYYPVAGEGTLAFEDLWPWWGDYDFNDLILDYRFKIVTNTSNEVVEVIGTFTVNANGAKMHNGFGFELPDADAGIAANVVVTGYSLTQGIITIDGTSHFESGQTNPVVIVFDDTWDLMEGIYNTVPGGAYTPPVPIDVTMTVTGGGPFEDTDFAFDTWNPFLFIDLTRGREVHLIDYSPTDLMDVDYFGQGDDASDPGTSTYYHTATGFPWGMDFPTTYEYTCEYREPSIAYLHFIEWIQSGGTLYTDWYSNTGAGYRNDTYIYAP
jgi:LruC domain-containing protein